MTKAPANNQVNKNLKDIALLFSIPIGIVTLMIAFLYVPRLFADPDYDFIYCSGSACEMDYEVSPSGKITMAPDTNKYGDPSSLNYYDTDTDSTRPLTLEEAQSFKVNEESRSPDGYVLELHRNTGSVFSSRYDDTWSLEKGFIAKPVMLAQNKTNNSFIGWVQQ